MGVILAKFRKSKTTYELLEKLENDIKNIEAYTLSTQERQKRIVGNFLLFSIGLYAIGFIVFYFVFFPPSWSERLVYSMPLMIFPVVILLLKRLVGWYFQRKLNKNSKQLNVLKAEKKKIIERVMDKETYKVALDIITRFAEPVKATSGALTPHTPGTITQYPTTPLRAPQQRHGSTTAVLHTSTTKAPSKQSNYPISPTIPPQIPLAIITQQKAAGASSYISSHQLSASPQNRLQPNYQQNRHQISMQQQQQQRTPFPIINQNEKSIFEKMVDFLIGDGPSSRYGMVCKQCYGHNGMASYEDYQYSAFTCAFCKTLNPARKLRPVAPNLVSDTVSLMGNSATTGITDTPLAVHQSIKESTVHSNDTTSSSERDSGMSVRSSDESDSSASPKSELENKTEERQSKQIQQPEEHLPSNEATTDSNEIQDVVNVVKEEIESEVKSEEEKVEEELPVEKPQDQKKND